MMYYIICIALCAVIVFIELMHMWERRDLYNRIMSKDIKDYRNFSGNAEMHHMPSRHDEVLQRWRDNNKKGGGVE